MITFTKEQLIARINQVTAINKYRISRDPAAEGLAMDNELLAIALALLEAEKGADPVAFINGAWTLVYYRPPKELGLKIGDKLYTAPPAPVSVPDDSAVELLATDLMKRIDKITGERHSVATLSSLRVSIVEACRAAMLQGAEPVTTANKLEVGENCWSCGKYFTYVEHSECDGYCPHCDSPVDLDDEEDQPSKVVPTNPTEEMISSAWREAIGKCDHETIKRIYATMLAAALQQEVK